MCIRDRFTAFAKGKKIEYRTESNDELKKLEEAAKKERYYEHAKTAIDALRAELNPDRTEELQRFRTDIEEVLRSEIAGRYYHTTGRAKSVLSTDPLVKRAIEVLNSTDYVGILNGTVKGN